MADPLLTVAQVAERLSVHYKTAQKLCRIGVDLGGIEAVNIGGAGPAARYRVRPSAVERYLRDRRVSA